MDVCMYLVVVGDGHLRGAFALLATLLATTTLCKTERNKQNFRNGHKKIQLKTVDRFFKITTNFTPVIQTGRIYDYEENASFYPYVQRYQNGEQYVKTRGSRKIFWNVSEKGFKDENVSYTAEYLGMYSEVYRSRNIYKSYQSFWADLRGQHIF